VKFHYYKQIPIVEEGDGEVSSFRRYELWGTIPKKVVRQGEEAMKKYAEEKVRRYFEKRRKEEEEHDRFAKNPNYPLLLSITVLF